MPRKNRVHYSHAFYHVMLRGNNRQKVFHCNDDYHNFLTYLKSAADLYGASIHLYCLMTNHIHIVIEVIDVPISKIMQSISTKYAKSCHKKYNTLGHVFQGRFKSKLIQDDRYLLELCYYIHMNPLKAGICQSLDNYKWSSHLAYMNQSTSTFVIMDHIRQLLSDSGSSYQDFISHYKNNDTQPPYCSFNNDGDLIIKDVVVNKMQNKPSLALENIHLHKIIRIVCDHIGVKVDDLSSSSQARRVTLARSLISYYSHYHAKYTLDELASYFCLQTDSLSKTMHRHLRKAKTDNNIRRIMRTLEGKLSMSDIDSLPIPTN